MNRSSPLAREEILDRALAIVRGEGCDAVSMRRLARDLGVTPGALYHHLPDKPALMSAMVDRVWELIFASMPPLGPDPIEFAVQSCLTIREVWLSYFDLASFGVAVTDAGEEFYEQAVGTAAIFEALGFPDVPLAFNALQTFTMGSVEIAANRRSASLYFGRDPKAARSRAMRLLSRHHASDNERGVVEARFDAGDDAHFEAGLRALTAGLLAGT